VLDHDAYQWFTEHGGLTAANGQEFRDKILSRGNSVELSTCTAISAARTRRWNRC
jgi:peptidyl-dipeptidase Dcp